MKINVLSLFDGMSVAQQALKECGIEVETYFASEIDKYSIATTQANFPNTIQLGDVKEVGNVWKKFGMKPNIDLLIGGSPCQDLSIAGKRKGLSGERSGLFYEYLRIRDEIRPKYFVLENVNSMPKEAKAEISKCLGVEPIMINASLVSAQNRKRLFWIGKLNEKTSRYKQINMELPEDRNILLKDILETDVDEKYYLNDSAIKTIHRNFGSKGKILDLTKEDSLLEKITYPSRITQTEGLKCPTLTSSMGTGGGNVPVLVTKNYGEWKERPDEKSTGLYAVIPEATKKGYAIAKEEDSIDLSFPNSKTRRGRVGNKVKNIMTGQNISTLTKNGIRKLTPTECLRLQSMPDNYFDKAICNNKPISNTQRYKMCGNAFNCEVIKHILNNIACA